MPEEDSRELIALDANNLISALLLYKIAAKTLTPLEINNVIDGGTETIIEQLSEHLDKNTVEKVVKDTTENMRDFIHKMR